MRALNLATLLLIIVGGQQAMLSKIVYVLVGQSALYQLVLFSKALSIGEPMA